MMRSVDWMKMTRADVVNFLWKYGVSTKYLKNRLRRLSLAVPNDIHALTDMSTFDVLNRPLEGKAFDSIAVGIRTQSAAERRFPDALVAAHIEAVALGTVPKETLAWMLDVDPGEIEVHPPQSRSVDLDEFAASLGLAAKV